MHPSAAGSLGSILGFGSSELQKRIMMLWETTAAVVVPNRAAKVQQLFSTIQEKVKNNLKFRANKNKMSRWAQAQPYARSPNVGRWSRSG